jgi:FixJ family two-component response regulator
MAQNDAFTTFLVRSDGTNLSKVGGCFAVEELLINFAEERSSSMSQDKPIVFVVDDDISVRESLEFLIRDVGWQSETFESAQAFLLYPRVFVPSCLVLDVNLPGLNGLDLQRRVAADRIGMPIIFITGYADVPMAIQAMKAGAVEFLTKPFGDRTLLSAIQESLELSRTALEREAEIRKLRERHDSLSRREREVMALVVRGLLNKQVGFELGISEITVKAHRGSLMRKMNAGSLAGLVAISVKLGFSALKPSTNERSGAFTHPADTARCIEMRASEGGHPSERYDPLWDSTNSRLI